MNSHKVTLNGQDFTRNSKARSYAHALAYRNPEGVWTVLGWTSNGEKALEKERRSWRKVAGQEWRAQDERELAQAMASTLCLVPNGADWVSCDCGGLGPEVEDLSTCQVIALCEECMAYAINEDGARQVTCPSGRIGLLAAEDLGAPDLAPWLVKALAEA